MGNANQTKPSAGRPDDAPPQNIDEVIGELARRYGEVLPRASDFDPGSLLGAMWALPITVQSNPPAPLLFKACATATVALAPQLSGQVVVYVTDAADVPLTPCN